MRYEYNEIGFNGIFITGGFEQIPDDNSHVIKIQSARDLHLCVMRSLCECDASLNGAMIRFMRLELAISQAQLGTLLGLEGRQMMSFYELNKRKMPLVTQEALKRMVLAKISGSLSVQQFDKQIKIKAPDSFEFVFVDNNWCWKNSPRFQMGIICGLLYAALRAIGQAFGEARTKSGSWSTTNAFEEARRIRREFDALRHTP